MERVRSAKEYDPKEACRRAARAYFQHREDCRRAQEEFDLDKTPEQVGYDDILSSIGSLFSCADSFDSVGINPPSDDTGSYFSLEDTANKTIIFMNFYTTFRRASSTVDILMCCFTFLSQFTGLTYVEALKKFFGKVKYFFKKVCDVDIGKMSLSFQENNSKSFRGFVDDLKQLFRFKESFLRSDLLIVLSNS